MDGGPLDNNKRTNTDEASEKPTNKKRKVEDTKNDNTEETTTIPHKSQKSILGYTINIREKTKDTIDKIKGNNKCGNKDKEIETDKDKKQVEVVTLYGIS